MKIRKKEQWILSETRGKAEDKGSERESVARAGTDS